MLPRRQSPPHRRMIGSTFSSKLQAPGMANEESHIQPLLQPANLLSHGALGDVELIGGSSEVQMPGCRIEHAQGVQVEPMQGGPQ